MHRLSSVVRAIPPRVLVALGLISYAGAICGATVLAGTHDGLLALTVAGLAALPHEPRKRVRVVIYIRASTDEANQPWTLAAQREALEAFVKSRKALGWVLVGIFEDRSTGANTERPGLQKLLACARKREFDVAVVYRVDRLSRKLLDTNELTNELENNEIALVSATEPFDTSDPIGRFILNLLATFAEFEREIMVDRIRAGQRKRRESGKFTGTPPTGMRLDDDGIPVADEDWLPMIVEAMELYGNELLGSTTVAKRLTDRGWTTKSGKRITAKTVLGWLACPTYVGLRREGDQLLNTAWEPVIDRQLWDKVQKILAERGEHPHLRRGNLTDYILAGLGRCQKCGATYIGKSANGNGGRYDYYTCQNRNRGGRDYGCANDNLPRNAYEDAVLDELLVLLRDTDMLIKAFSKAQAAQRRSLKDVKADAARMRRKRTTLEQKRDRYFAAFESGKMDPALCSARLAELSAQIDEASADLILYEARIAEVDVEFPRDAITVARQTLETLFDSGYTDPLSEEEAATAKALLRLLIKNISIGGRDDITVTYRLPLGTTGEAVRTISPEVDLTGFEPALPGSQPSVPPQPLQAQSTSPSRLISHDPGSTRRPDLTLVGASWYV